MRRGFAIAAVAFACGGKRPPPVVNVQQETPDSTISYGPYSYRASAPRPAIDVDDFTPDFHDELRWPLSGMEHPTLAPRFAVAQELAVGIDWEQLCQRGVQNRVSATQKELLTYLRGWCYAAKRDVDNACAQLTPLISSTRSGLRPAVRQDLANILVQEGADRAEHWLKKHNIRDIHILDLLAANFVEIGSEADALVLVDRAIDADDYATVATKCRRLVKRIVLTRGSGDSAIAVVQLKDLATVKVPEEVCRTAYNKIDCWLNRTTLGCRGYFKDENLDPRMIFLYEAYRAWPSGESDSSAWRWVAARAEEALPLAGAADLVVGAWEATLRAIPNCPAVAMDLHAAIATLRSDPSNAAFEARLAKLSQDCPQPTLPVATATASPQASVQPATATPTAKAAAPACDNDALEAKGMDLINAKKYAAALVQLEAALACAPKPFTAELAFIASCHSKNAEKAKRYYKLIPKEHQDNYAQICVRNGVSYE